MSLVRDQIRRLSRRKPNPATAPSSKVVGPPRWPQWRLTAAAQALVAGCLIAGCVWLIYCASGLFGQKQIRFAHGGGQAMRFQMDINRATWPELAQIESVGETLARRIVAHREQIGGFTSLDQLREVPGIGKKTWERMRGKVVVRGNTQ